MRNKYPGLCRVCKENVTPGDGVLSKENGRWLVTHAEACPTDPHRKAEARSSADRAIRILDSPGSEEAHVISALFALARLVDDGWLDKERCYEKILSSLALRKMDRLKVEMLLDTYWSASVSS